MWKQMRIIELSAAVINAAVSIDFCSFGDFGRKPGSQSSFLLLSFGQFDINVLVACLVPSEDEKSIIDKIRGQGSPPCVEF